jgi:tRNA (guanine-N7-)-methyltransferase
MNVLWHSVFGNDRRVEVEIGPGTGTFLLAAAARDPHTNFLGIEHSHTRAAYLAMAIEERTLHNARVITADASCVVATVLPTESVDVYHIYFPDPWWKRRHHRRRLFTPAFAAALVQTLTVGGRLYVATDVDDVFTLALKTLSPCAGLIRESDRPPPRPGVTVFERKGIVRGAAIREAAFIKRSATTDAAPTHTNNAAPITPAESPS